MSFHSNTDPGRDASPVFCLITTTTTLDRFSYSLPEGFLRRQLNTRVSLIQFFLSLLTYRTRFKDRPLLCSSYDPRLSSVGLPPSRLLRSYQTPPPTSPSVPDLCVPEPQYTSSTPNEILDTL